LPIGGCLITFRNFTPKELKQKALRSEVNEAIEILYETDNITLLVGARHSIKDHCTFFIEVYVYPSQDLQATDISLLKKQYHLIKALHALGFSSFRDGVAIIAESTTSFETISADLGRVRHSIMGSFR
jgi:hypothetical protein